MHMSASDAGKTSTYTSDSHVQMEHCLGLAEDLGNAEACTRMQLLQKQIKLQLEWHERTHPNHYQNKKQLDVDPTSND